MAPLTLEAIGFAWLPILPMVVVTAIALAVLLAGVRVRDDDSTGLAYLALGGLAIAFVLATGLIGQRDSAFGGAILIDNFAAYFQIAIVLTAAGAVMLSAGYAEQFRLRGAEYYALILFAAVGMMLMAAAGDLIVIFLGLETMSVALYALAGLARRDPRSNEAALKYFLLGAFSTGFLLYGIALIYGATAAVRLDEIRVAVSDAQAPNPLVLLGIGMLLVGFGFKVAAAPFHTWAPDVYQGAPTPVTAFMAVGVKLAAFAAFLRLFMVALEPLAGEWSWVIWVGAAATMTVGNLIAIVQTNIKRMLAYSAIAHAGYVLVGMAAGDSASGGAILYYLVAYGFANLGAFGVVIALERRADTGDEIAHFRGLSAREPALAAAMALFMLSLTGIPPLAGFVAKFYLFSAAVEQGLIGLVIIAVLNSVASAYYYIYVIVAMYMQEGAPEVVPLASRPGLVAAVTFAAIAIVLIGVYPQPSMSAAADAFASALGAGPQAARLLAP
jgi:NADH-quinone oxidoreductase subunit N